MNNSQRTCVLVALALFTANCSSNRDVGKIAVKQLAASDTHKKSVIAIPMGLSEDWRDFAFLSAVAASSNSNDGQPAVLALDPYGTVRPEMRDFLDRYRAESIYMLQERSPILFPENGLIASWPLDGSAKQVSSRLKYHPIWKAKRGSNYLFNGKLISIDKGTTPGSTKELTVAFWVKPENSQDCPVVRKMGHEPRSPGWAITLRETRGKRYVRFRIGGGGRAYYESDVVSANCYNNGQWTHITCTHKDGVSKIYINGYLKATREKITWSTPNNTEDPLSVGNGFNGMLDDLRIYNRELNEIEIQRVPGESGATSHGLIGHWAFDRADANNINGLIGDQHLAIEGAPVLEKGKNGNAMHFKKNDLLTLGKSISRSEDFTVSFKLSIPKAQKGYLIKKASTADEIFPWNFSIHANRLSFQVGNHADNRVTAKDTIEYNREYRVTGICSKGSISLRLDNIEQGGKRIRTEPSQATHILPFAECQVDDIKIYHLAGDAKDKALLLSDEHLVAHWTLDKERMLLEETASMKINSKVTSTHFNGINSYLRVRAPSLGAADLTVSFWVKPERTGALISRFADQRRNKGWAISLDKKMNSVKVQIRGKESPVPIHTFSQTECFTMNRWNHLAVIFSGNGVTFFLNGKQVINWRKKGININEPRTPLTVGCLHPGIKHFKGEMKNLRLHSRVLSEDEVLAIFAEGSDWKRSTGITTIGGRDETTAAESMARMFWKTSPIVVISDKKDYGNSLCASALAARIKAPLLFMNNGRLAASTLRILHQLDCKKLIMIGDYRKEGLGNFGVTNLKSSTEIIRWLKDNDYEVEYFAAANPYDRTLGFVNKASLAAPLLAARRNGAVAILDFKTIWNRPFTGLSAKDPKAERKKKTPPVYPLTGKMSLNGTTESFVVEQKKGRNARYVKFTRPDGSTSPALFTGDHYAVGDKTFTLSVVDLAYAEKGDFRMTWPSVPKIKEKLRTHYDALGKHPKYVCFLGLPDVIPSALIPKRRTYNSDGLVNDHVLLNTDDDPFIEVAPGRIFGEDVYSTVLTATRCVNYEHLIDKDWSKNYGTAGWYGEIASDMKKKGFSFIGHHTQKEKGLITDDSPFRNASIILHGQHSAPWEFGGFMKWNTSVLFSPCLINSGGCSTMGLNRMRDRKLVTARALRNGAVCITGNSNLGISAQQLYTTEFLNAILRDEKTVGEAHLFALNRALLAALSKGETEQGLHRYQYHIRMLYGDPALKVRLPAKPLKGAAHHRIEGNTVTVHGPDEWMLKTGRPPGNPSTKEPKLCFFHGTGMGAEAWYSGKLRRRCEQYVYTVEVPVNYEVSEVKQITQTPLGWDGKFWIDKHQDGTRSALWRVKLVDTKVESKEILKSVSEVSFKIKRGQ